MLPLSGGNSCFKPSGRRAIYSFAYVLWPELNAEHICLSTALFIAATTDHPIGD